MYPPINAEYSKHLYWIYCPSIYLCSTPPTYAIRSYMMDDFGNLYRVSFYKASIALFT